MGLSTLAIALALATANERLIEWFVAPLFEKFKWDTLFLRYIAGVTGFLICFFGKVNLFTDFVPNVLLGLILTALFVGGGSNLVHEVFSNSAKKAAFYAKE